MPDEFAGGAGACPRCKIALQIPTPLAENSPYYVTGLRYIAYPSGAVPPEGLPLIAISGLGPSLRYECPHCEEKYESLAAPGFRQGTCPKCGAVNTPAGEEAEFPRKFRTPEDGTAPIQMEGDFLLAQPSIDQTPSDSIIEGVMIPEDSAATEETIEEPDDESQVIPPSSEVPDIPNHMKWSYLVKGKPAGPVSVGGLLRLQQSGKINPSTPVWQHGMDGWMPIEKFPQLLYKPEHEQPHDKPEKKPQPTQYQLSRYLLRHCQYIFWSFVAVISFLILMLITQQTFSDLGPETIPIVSMGFAFGILCMLIYGVIFVGINSKRMKILPPIIRMQSFGGILGLTGCLVITLLFGFRPMQEEQYTQTHVQWSIQRAREVTSVFEQDKLRQSYNIVKWREFTFNGADIGAKYQRAKTPADKNKVIAVVFAAFNEAMKPPPKPKPKPGDKSKNLATASPTDKPSENPDEIVPVKPEKVEPPRLTRWRIVPSASELTIVEAVNSANARKFIFAFKIGMLVELEIKKAPKKPAPKPKSDKKVH